MESKGQNWTNIAIDEDIIIDLEEDGVIDKKQTCKPKNIFVKLKSMTRAVPLKNKKVRVGLLSKIEPKNKKSPNFNCNSSESIDKTAKTNIKKRKKMPALNSLVPINLFEEKKTFFDKSSNYNPIFNYPDVEVELPVV